MVSKRVFVIEPDQVVRSALGYILSGRHETFTFAEPADALTKAAAPAPDIVLVGVSILEGNGTETVATLAQEFDRAGIIVVADSATAPLALAGLRHGAQAIIAKPITFEGVTRAVEPVLARRGPGPRLATSSSPMSTEIGR